MEADGRSSRMNEPKHAKKIGRAFRWSIGIATMAIVGAGAYGWFGQLGLGSARSASPPAPALSWRMSRREFGPARPQAPG